MNKKDQRILLVDDDRLILATMSDGLKQEGYNVFIAETGKHARKLIQEQDLNLVILDIRMPDCSGIDIAIDIISKYALPVIFLSAYSDKATVESALSSGANSFLVKPITFQQLLPEVEISLARSKDLKKLRDSEYHLSKALEQDRSISIAVGLLMERYKLDQDKSFELLRKNARTQRRKVSDLAQELVTVIGAFNTFKMD